MNMTRWIRNQLDRASAIALVVVGLGVLVLGWLGVRDAELATQQIPYIASGGLFGLFMLGVGCTLWLSADLRDEWRKLDDIHSTMRSSENEYGSGRTEERRQGDPGNPDDDADVRSANGKDRPIRPIRASR